MVGLLRRVFGPPLYMGSIVAFYMPAVIALIFCGVLYSGRPIPRRNRPVLAALILDIAAGYEPPQYVLLFAAGWTAAIDI